MSNAALLHHFLKLSTTSFIWHKSDSEHRGEDMESGAWEQGAGSGLHRSWGRERCKSQRHGSAFICITRMQCTQYSFYLLFQFIIIFLNVVFWRMSLHPLRRKDLLQTLDLDLPLILLSLTVLGVSVPSSLWAQAQWVSHSSRGPPESFVLYLRLGWSGPREEYGQVKPNFWRSFSRPTLLCSKTDLEERKFGGRVFSGAPIRKGFLCVYHVQSWG